MFTCQNPSCRKNFTAPLKTLNLQQNPNELYFSCPHCLTKIQIEQPRKTNKIQEEILLQKNQTEVNQVEEKEKMLQIMLSQRLAIITMAT